ncbi:MAG: sugar phosphate permease [Yoonia sp.]|jgi:sugar phosphate permease
MASARDTKAPLCPAQGGSLTLWVILITYGSFYFCRTNISAAIPGIEEEFALSKTQIGFILGSLKIAYGIGQFVNGQLAERISPRKLLTIGMLMSALLNVVFGFGTGLYFLIFVWACNGYFQALGWTPCMRVAANWFPPETRGRSIGIIGTGYQATAALTFIVSGFAADYFGWRGAFFVPAGILMLSCIHMLFFLKETPAAVAGPNDGETPSEELPKVTQPSFRETIRITVNNPALWILAIALALLNACRYGFLDWGLPFMVETTGESISKSALKYAILPVGGVLGSYLAGWTTDRYFGGRRAPLICMLMLLLGGLTLMFSSVVQIGLGPALIMLACTGFTIYGPQVLLVGTAAIDLAKSGAPAAAVGLVNFMGYMGAFAGDQVTGMLVDNYDWSAALGFWAGCAILGAAVVSLLWNRGPETPEEAK